MSFTSSLHPDASVAVIGASGGIGRAFVELLADDSGVRAVHALSREPGAWDHPNVTPHRLDFSDEESIEAAAAAASSDAPLDLVIVATGILSAAGFDDTAYDFSLSADGAGSLFAFSATLAPTVIPVPGALLLFASGLAALGLRRRS